MKFVDSIMFFTFVRHRRALALSALTLFASAIFAPPSFAVKDEERKYDLPLPVTKKKFVAVYGDKYLRAIEAKIAAFAKENNIDWTEKKEDHIRQQVKKLLAQETEPHALATLAIWAIMNREDDPLVRRVYHYDKIIESAYYQAMFRIADIGGEEAAPALYRIMHQTNMDKDAMEKLRDCLNSVEPDGFKSQSRVIVKFSDARLNERPAPEDVAQFVVPLREALWRIWQSPTLIASELNASAQFTVDETLSISGIKVTTVVKDCPASVFSMRNEYKRNALKALNKLRITQKLPMFTKSTDVFVDFYGP
ncbi:MAG: hypothetical protein K2Y39_05020 [Candidatus Obscuribacterales bacterium]|nr:hypothetical protein [Candidatus Obscuribacterales bacterium]